MRLFLALTGLLLIVPACDRGTSMSTHTRLNGGTFVLNSTVVHEADGRNLDSILKETAERQEVTALGDVAALRKRIVLTVGDIVVRTAADEPPRLVTTWKLSAPTHPEAAAALEKFSLSFEKSADEWRASTAGEPVALSVAGQSVRISPTATCTLYLPAGQTVNATTNIGKINLTGTYEQITANCTIGSVSIADGGATSMALTVQTGDITVRNAQYVDLSAETQFGRVRVTSCAGRVTARTQTGDVSVVDCRPGPATATAILESGGYPAGIIASARAGTITVEKCTGVISAQCDTGNIRVSGVLQGVQAVSQAGSIEVTAMPGSELLSPLMATCSAGDVRAVLPVALTGHLEASAALGDIRLKGEFPTRPVREGVGERLSAKLGNGSIRIALSTRAGSIDISRQ